jgi:glycosyltransferase involved in cell wall biosynthesis
MIPKVSVIITAHNRERSIGKSIDSILAQSYKDFDLLIWDDGSTDKTFMIACGYARKDKRIRIAAYDHRGPVRALKEAISDTIGPFFGWLNSESILEANALEEAVAVLEGGNGAGALYTNKSPVMQPYDSSRLNVNTHDELLGDLMAFPFFMMRRDFYKHLGATDQRSRS